MTVPWKGLDDYKKADRLVWKIKDTDKEVAGYVRQVRNFYQVCIYFSLLLHCCFTSTVNI